MRWNRRWFETMTPLGVQEYLLSCNRQYKIAKPILRVTGCVYVETATASGWAVLDYVPGVARAKAVCEVHKPGEAWMSGTYLRLLMRRRKVKVKQLAKTLGTTQLRVKEVLYSGLTGPAVRDWIEAVTGHDPGKFYATSRCWLDGLTTPTV